MSWWPKTVTAWYKWWFQGALVCNPYHNYCQVNLQFNFLDYIRHTRKRPASTIWWCFWFCSSFPCPHPQCSCIVFQIAKKKYRKELYSWYCRVTCTHTACSLACTLYGVFKIPFSKRYMQGNRFLAAERIVIFWFILHSWHLTLNTVSLLII